MLASGRIAIDLLEILTVVGRTVDVAASSCAVAGAFTRFGFEGFSLVPGLSTKNKIAPITTSTAAIAIIGMRLDFAEGATGALAEGATISLRVSIALRGASSSRFTWSTNCDDATPLA